jgi:peroxiredoxin Q/BCP
VRSGDLLPDFAGTTASGATISRSDLRGRPAVLFFYPRAGSPGCSLESREFARLHARFEAAGIRVVGISVDSQEAQQRFRDDCHLPFDLLADQGREISRRFGVLGALGMARRTTFLVDSDGKVLEVIRTWRPGRHAENALERLTAERPPEAAAPSRGSERP